MSEIIGEYLDRLCTIEMRPGKSNLPRGVIHRLYAAARARVDRPLTLDMAQALYDTVGADDTVFIVTGAGGPPILPKGEVDGVPGAAALARALHFGLGAKIVILTEARVQEPVAAAVRAAGMNFRLSDEAEMNHAVTFIPTPIDDDPCRLQAADLINAYRPRAVIAIEKLAPNRMGVIHGSTGLDYTPVHSKAHHLFDEAAKAGILTCGIGDGGNEIGFGVIPEAVADIMPAGRVCLCSCGSGSASATATDKFVVAAISNWGGYAVSAVLAYLLERPNILINEGHLDRMIRATVDAGAFDGAVGRPSLSDDGVQLPAHLAYITMLRSIVSIALSTLDSPGH